MISPPVTVCPENTLTPRRFAFESRPFREEPSPFLCAIVNLLWSLGCLAGARLARSGLGRRGLRVRLRGGRLRRPRLARLSRVSGWLRRPRLARLRRWLRRARLASDRLDRVRLAGGLLSR